MSRAARRAVAALALALATALTGCATAAGPRASPPPHDPIERFNRAVYAFNDALDTALIRPVTVAYVNVVPEPVKFMVGNVFGNVADVWTGVNNLLQGKPLDALNDLARVVLNTTFGLYGLADIATDLGFERRREDFGQTLGVWGFESGPYLVLPFFGPSSLRDAIGLAVDSSYDPVWHAPQRNRHRNLAYGLRVIDTRSTLLAGDRILQAAALDPYVLLREGYLQRRRSMVYDGSPPPKDYDDD
ncbi:MAG TPA: VacJ family lipoprotein [Burkholderiaceae bacterium]|nr:VacJ family lipoprotein [Burkholderiaceae bacterium]